MASTDWAACSANGRRRPARQRAVTAAQGNNVLGDIFGSKDVSRAVAENADSRSGLNPPVLKKMLPILAMLVGGYIAKQRGVGGMAAGPGGLFGLAQGHVLRMIAGRR